MLYVEAKAERYNLIVIDNLMSILEVNNSREKLDAQANFMQRCCDLSKALNNHIILVLHPNKTLQKNQEMDFEQISGTQDLANKADNIIAVRREYDEDKVKQKICGYIEILKNRYYKDLKEANIFYDEETNLLLQRSDNGDIGTYTFSYKRFLEGEQTIFAGDSIKGESIFDD